MRQPGSILRGAVLTLLFAVGEVGAEAEPGSVSGRVTLGLPATTLAQLLPVVVYLEPVDAPAGHLVPSDTVQIAQDNARFSPAFRVVVVGQTVEMPNGDAIFHNVFSYSRPNGFDLGIYPSGESRSVRFDYPGVVKTYCSIHESMNGTIFVAPSAHFAVLRPSGRFLIGAVPPGRYRLKTWCEKLPGTSREITVRPGAALSLSISLADLGAE